MHQSKADENAVPTSSKDAQDQEESLPRLRADLKARAESFIVIPQSYKLTIDEYLDKASSGATAMFVWTEPGTDNGISIEVSSRGELVDFSIDADDGMGNIEADLPYEELKERALKFVLNHYPEALDQFVPVLEKQLPSGEWLFGYGQEAMGLPLPHSGFRVRVSPDGTVVNLNYFGLHIKPEPPMNIVPKEKLLLHIADTVDFHLQMSIVQQSDNNTFKDSLRLVYQPFPYMTLFEADELRSDLATETPLSESLQDNSEQWLSVSVLPGEQQAETDEPLSLHDLIGIDIDVYELLREVDMSGRTGLVLRRRDFTPSGEGDLSLNSFFQNRTEQTVKAQVDPESGRLISLMRFEDLAGELHLSRDECLDIAVRFLNQTSPGLLPFLQLQQDNGRDESDSELFVFRVNIGGVALEMEHMRIVVNKTTGQIDQLLGLSVATDCLSDFDTTPQISSSEARNRYLNAVDLLLEWATDYTSKSEQRSYKLQYRVVHKESGEDVRMVDAISGEVLSWRM